MQRFHYDTIGSTNSQARGLAAEHPGDVLLVTAGEQTAGRGRRGRTWHSPRGGAWMSFVWPMTRPASAYAATSLVAGVALRRAIRQVAGDGADLHIKWPNDLLAGGRKLAGILCEQRPGAGGATGTLVIGIGVNIDFDDELFPPELRPSATTLRAAVGRAPTVEEVIAATAREVAVAMQALEREGLSEAMLTELRGALAYVGEVQVWDSPRGVVTGRVLGLDGVGRLLLETADGTIACESGEFA